jgi:LAO/AO transport system kinase
MTEIARQILGGDLRALARAASWVENRRPEAESLLGELSAHTGRALILGVTGAPGAGKSTLVDQFIRLLRNEGKTVGVIAIDPSSPYSGGAILGDRIRMQEHHADPGVFIRSVAARGWPGGVARATSEMTTVLDAAGRDVVIVETVGVGQGEVEIARLVDVTMLVLVPGMGDEVQSIKAGIMEIADVFVINKSDLPGAGKLDQELRSYFGLAHRPDGWTPRIVHTVANEGKGIAEALAAVREYVGRAPSPARDRVPSGRVPSKLPVIDHLGIAVRSLDQALGFYQDQLGLNVSIRQTVAQEKVNVAMLPLGESRIELLEPASQDSTIEKFLDKRGGGLHHVAIRVPDLKGAVERLRASGARVLNEPRSGAGGHLYVFVHPDSTGGVLLELIQA